MPLSRSASFSRFGVWDLLLSNSISRIFFYVFVWRSSPFNSVSGTHTLWMVLKRCCSFASLFYVCSENKEIIYVPAWTALKFCPRVFFFTSFFLLSDAPRNKSSLCMACGIFNKWEYPLGTVTRCGYRFLYFLINIGGNLKIVFRCYGRCNWWQTLSMSRFPQISFFVLAF